MGAHPLIIIVVIGFAILLYVVLTLASRRPKKPRGKLEGGPYFQGAALTGTGRVLSMKSTQVRPSRSDPGIYELALAVEVPGLQPYEVTFKQKLPDWALLISMSKPAVLRTNLVTVEVDSAHPERVRVVGDDKGRWYA
jgi:hypothetical protein